MENRVRLTHSSSVDDSDRDGPARGTASDCGRASGGQTGPKPRENRLQTKPILDSAAR